MAMELENVLAQYHTLMNELHSTDEGPNAASESTTRVFSSPMNDVGVFIAPSDSTELDLLRRNNVSLMEALNEERRLRTKAESALALAQDDMSLLRLEAESEVEGYRLASCRLQNQVRCLCEETGMEEVFRLFEVELKRLSKEMEALRARNVQLELASSSSRTSNAQEGETIGAVDFDAVATSSGGEGSPIQAPPFAGYNSRESKRMLLRLRQKTTEADNLWKECEKLRAAERSHAFSLRQSRDSTRRLNLAAQMTLRQKSLLEQEQAEHMTTKSSLTVVQHEANSLEEECRAQRREIDSLKSELALMRSRLSDAQIKARQTTKMANFVAKHKGGSWR